HSAAHRERNAVGRFGIGERLLEGERGGDRIEWVPEGAMDAIAGRLHYHAAMRLHRRPSEMVVARQRPPHPLGLLLPQPAAALDVGEEKRGDVGSGLHPKPLCSVAARSQVYRRGVSVATLLLRLYLPCY